MKSKEKEIIHIGNDNRCNTCFRDGIHKAYRDFLKWLSEKRDCIDGIDVIDVDIMIKLLKKELLK